MYFIHTSGTGILTFADTAAGAYGEPSDKIYDDWTLVDEVTSLPDEARHRPVDKIILGAGASGSLVKTAIVCPSTIYGPGRGPGNTVSIQWYRMVQCALKRQKAFCVGKGLNRWTYINVLDLSQLYLFLIEAALEQNTDDHIWGPKGYFFCEAGEFVWAEIAELIAKECYKQGYLKSEEVEQLSPHKTEELLAKGPNLWGRNSRCRAIRAGKVFGWRPIGKSPEEEMPGIVDHEAEAAGLAKSHAQIAAGE